MTTTSTPAAAHTHSNAYSIFILVLTVVSLVVMVLLLMPFSSQTLVLLLAYDNIICFIFLGDFALSLKRAPSKRGYFVGERGWLDLLGSIPTLPGLEALGILRLARLSRLTRIQRVLGGQNKQELLEDLLRNRAQYAVLITVLAAFLVMGIASLVVLQAESKSPDANITTAGDALWWAVVTITTVGYGDHYPTTTVGRFAAVFVMIMGIGIIGSLASIMASILVSPAPAETAPPTPAAASDLEQKVDQLAAELGRANAELTTLHQMIEQLDTRDASNGQRGSGRTETRSGGP